MDKPYTESTKLCNASNLQYCNPLYHCNCELTIEWYSGGEQYYRDARDEVENSAKISALEELLATKLAEYLDSTFSYTLTKLSSAAQASLYKGPAQSEEEIIQQLL